MISKIYMNEYATYKNEGAYLDDCKKINFIYGANGSGKSVISNYLQVCSNDTYDMEYACCNVEWSTEFKSDIYVYNSSFIESNFKSTIPGIFTLGRANIIEQETIDANKAKREQIYNKYIATIDARNRIKQNIQDKTLDFKNTVWQRILKKYLNDFKDAFYGVRSSKDKFLNELINRFKSNNGEYQPLVKLKERAAILYSDNLKRCNTIDLDIYSVKHQISMIISDPVWQTVVIGSKDIDIGKLIHELDNSDWVSKGIDYINAGSTVCPFCQQETITDEFRHKLEMFFNRDYKDQIDKIKNLIADYSECKDIVINELHNIMNNSEIFSVGKVDKESFAKDCQLLIDAFDKNLQLMETKQNEPSRKIDIYDSNSIIDDICNCILTANENIRRYNKLANDADKESRRLRDDLWAFCLTENEKMISDYHKNIKRMHFELSIIDSQIEHLKEQINQLDEVIKNQEETLTGVTPSINAINQILQTYGFTNFKIEPSNIQTNSYEIRRNDGQLANYTLSDGEITFITFLYFMQLVKGAFEVDKISNKKIFVLDDPINALDSTMLNVVSNMINTLAADVQNDISNIEQLFLFTHNVFLFKEASSNLVDDNVNYWIIRKTHDKSYITNYERYNPINTYYNLLWCEIKDSNSIISIKNSMRRILEHCFKFSNDDDRDEHILNLFKSKRDKLMCDSFLGWLHSEEYDEIEEASLNKYKDCFRQIFDNSGNGSHYTTMMNFGNKNMYWKK